ncbi:S45A3 protein, partial [Prunella himalayana]|nr:S45A3 protein [Prunella himalayana]
AGGSMSFQSRRAQLLLVNSLTFGLEVCLAAGITYVPPLLLEVGVEEKFMTMVLGIGPVLGLLFVPLIGSASDHWHSSYGRRRPFIWLLCLGVLLSLFLIPHASSLAGLCALNARPLEIAFLIVGIGLLDFCGQVCFTPLEALLSDLFQEPDDCRQAFSVYAFMVSLGGCVGYLLPAIDWAFLAPYLGGQQSCLFSLLALIFLGCVLATLFVAEEAAQGDLQDGPALKDVSPEVSPWCCWRGPCLLQARRALQAGRQLCVLLPRLHGLYCRIPRVIRRLFVAELCSWMALMTFMLFYTDFVGEGLYHGVPRARPGTEARRHYDEGVRMGSLGLFLQCITSIFFSTIMDRLVKHFGTRAVYLASVVFFPGAAFVMCLSHSVTVVTISAALTGFTFSALQILPYTLASLYHHDKQVFLHKYKRKEEEDAALLDKKSAFSKGLLSSQKLSFQNGHAGSLFSSSSSPSSSSPSSPPAMSSSALCVSSPCDVSLRIMVGDAEPGAPGRGICLDLAILDSAFLLSQVVPSLFMGTIVQFTQSVTAYMVSAAGLGLVAIYFATKVVFDKGDMAKYSV